MKEDKILKMLFEPERWQQAISKGVDKGIDKATLYQLTTPEARALLYQRIRDGQYKIMPPHAALIPKDNGDFRTVYVNEPVDRVLLSGINDLLFDLAPDMVHSSCKSYQKGIGCGRVVQEASRMVCAAEGKTIGFKSDLSKYFDSVPLSFIDAIFDRVEEMHGQSALIALLRSYYHCDTFFDPDGNICNSYQSLKQGCAVAAWLADVLLYHIDEKLSCLNGYYVRYSDDMLFIGDDYAQAMTVLQQELDKMSMKLNPNKVEYLDSNHWFKFLGFAVKGHDISLSPSRIKTFQKEIERRTVNWRETTLQRAVNAVNKYLYKGFGSHSWATQVLPIVNVKRDVSILNTFVLDCLRAVQTGKKKLGGLGFDKTQKDGCIARGKGKNVRANRLATEQIIEGYLPIGCAQAAMLTRRAAYDALVDNI